MFKNEYSIGTRIKYIHTRNCEHFMADSNGKTGKIVDIIHGWPLIYIPTSKYVSQYSTKKRPATVQIDWKNIERITIKHEQLVFSFMEK